MFLNVLAPPRATGDMRIPPDGETFGLKRVDKLDQPRPVLGLVRDE
jgi:hypothetical protein